jgi:hypothetical protein
MTVLELDTIKPKNFLLNGLKGKRNSFLFLLNETPVNNILWIMIDTCNIVDDRFF